MPEQKILVIIPTYNERDNIINLIRDINNKSIDALDILVVDDGSDDTGELVKEEGRRTRNLFVIKRERKSGRGTAVIAGLKFGLAHHYESMVEMDADFSHSPDELAGLLASATENSIVIASRYLPGSRIIGWPLSRRIFSKLANLLASVILAVGIVDYTNGYRVYPRSVVEKLEFDKVKSVGYIVLSEIVYQLYKKGVKFIERPTIFVNRQRGTSKFSLVEIKQSLVGLLKIRFGK